MSSTPSVGFVSISPDSPSSRASAQAMSSASSSSTLPSDFVCAAPGRASPSAPPFPLQVGLVDARVLKIRPLLPPACLLEEFPTSAEVQGHVVQSRIRATEIIHGRDDRLIVVVGPCSIHDTKAALEYAHKLKQEADKHAKDLFVCMRVYLEKPRTTVGWKGLINDPELDGSFNINAGLRVSRKLLLDLNEIGLPLASEMLDTITPQYISDLISWGAIGARTSESQLHRELVSGLSFPIGFKNGTGGSLKVATDAIVASRHPHAFLGVTSQGVAAIIETKGNPDCHIVLRGGDAGPNYQKKDIEESIQLLKQSKGPCAVMIDCSHGNAVGADGTKSHTNQLTVVSEVCRQLSSSDSPSCSSLVGVMLESNLVSGAQKLTCGPGKKAQLTYGQSVTDACVSWTETEQLLETLAQAVRQRRSNREKNGQHS